MTSDDHRIPSSSQTVGPFFRIGLDYLIDRMAEANANVEDMLEIRGSVLDRDGAPVPDAMLEFWSVGDPRNASNDSGEHGIPDRFGRMGTDMDGGFRVRIKKPVALQPEGEMVQASHMMVLVFARGLMRHLITRVYLEDAAGIERDQVLLAVPAERRSTLVAKAEGPNAYRWNVILQGADETVFFAW